jgi:hypothetical protein
LKTCWPVGWRHERQPSPDDNLRDDDFGHPVISVAFKAKNPYEMQNAAPRFALRERNGFAELQASLCGQHISAAIDRSAGDLRMDSISNEKTILSRRWPK